MLVVSGRGLEDNNTLEDYNVQEFGEIVLKEQTGVDSTDTDSDVSKKAVNKLDKWDEIAAEAHNNFESELKEKKVQYNKLTQNKATAENDMKIFTKSIDEDLKKQFNAEKEIESFKLEVERKKTEIKELEKSINKRTNYKETLVQSANQKRSGRENKIK